MRIYALLPIINKSIYSGKVKLWSPRTDEFFKGIFSCYSVVEDLLLQEVVEMFEKIVIRQKMVWGVSCIR